MAVSKKSKKREYLNSTNAQAVANRGMNAAFSQAQGYLVRNEDTGRWEEGGAYTRSASGKMSTNGRTAGGSTWTMTPKNDNGTAVLTAKGLVRQSGRSQIANRNQRRYDVVSGLNNVVGEKAREMLGVQAGQRGLGMSIG